MAKNVDRGKYPVVATITYKEKDLLSVSLPIRAKLIVYPVYHCPECRKKNYSMFGDDLSATQFAKCTNMSDEWTEDMIYSHKFKTKMNKKCFNNEVPVKCPRCMINLKKKEKRLVKLYTKADHPFVSYSEIIHHTIGLTRRKKTEDWYGKNTVYNLFLKDLDEVYKVMKEVRKSLKRIKGEKHKAYKNLKNTSIVVHKKISMSVLEKAYEDYLSRRLVRSL